jgi:hypothetical protein
MLTAKFMKMGKAGALAIYEVQGTSAELTDYISNNFKDAPKGPAFKSAPNGDAILDSSGNKIPLYFTAYPLPGKDLKHPLYKVQAGANIGKYTLDKSEIQYESLVAKSMGSNLGDQIATQMAQKWVSSAPINKGLASLVDDSDDSEDDASETPADLTLKTVKAPK